MRMTSRVAGLLLIKNHSRACSYAVASSEKYLGLSQTTQRDSRREERERQARSDQYNVELYICISYPARAAHLHPPANEGLTTSNKLYLSLTQTVGCNL